MAVLKLKKQFKEKSVRTVIACALYAMLAIFIVCLFVFNAKYTDIYKSPKVRGRSVINTKMATCDMWEFVDNGGVFSGKYMPQYDWSIVREATLEQMKKQQ